MVSPLISVIIPTYNRANKVLTAVESVRSLSYANVQLIVVDDGSTDHTRELLHGLEGLTYIYQLNGGQASARNVGLALATGEYIASLASDDYWENDFLQKTITALILHTADFTLTNWNQKKQKKHRKAK